jgi:hypothetical protein
MLWRLSRRHSGLVIAERALQSRRDIVFVSSTPLLQRAASHVASTIMESGADRGVRPGEHEDGTLAKQIEEQTTKLPSDAFLWAAVASIVGSLAF